MRDGEGKTTIVIPPVVGVAVVGVQPTTIVVPVRVEEFRVATENCVGCHLCHRPLNTLGAESNPAS